MGSKELVRLVRVRRMVGDGTARQIRKEAGLTIREVADAIDVSTGAVHHWESGRRVPRGSAQVLRYGALLEALGKERETTRAGP